jgi:hypothetical protein
MYLTKQAAPSHGRDRQVSARFTPEDVEKLVQALSDEIVSSWLVDGRAPASEVRAFAQCLADTALRVLEVRRTSHQNYVLKSGEMRFRVSNVGDADNGPGVKVVIWSLAHFRLLGDGVVDNDSMGNLIAEFAVLGRPPHGCGEKIDEFLVKRGVCQGRKHEVPSRLKAASGIEDGICHGRARSAQKLEAVCETSLQGRPRIDGSAILEVECVGEFGNVLAADVEFRLRDGGHSNG